MQINGEVVFVTGSNRGLGKALVDALKNRGAAKIYASSRSGAAIPGTVPLQLDITNPIEVMAAARVATDTTILINNAGINFNAPLLNSLNEHHAKLEMDVNYFGTLAMCRAFAPILGKNGGGTIVNMASVGGRVSFPVMGSLCASKAALISLSQSIRAQLTQQQTQVVLVMPGPIDTEMSKYVPMEKANPADVAESILDAIENGVEDLYPDAMAQFIAQQLAADYKAVEKSVAVYLP